MFYPVQWLPTMLSAWQPCNQALISLPRGLGWSGGGVELSYLGECCLGDNSHPWGKYGDVILGYYNCFLLTQGDLVKAVPRYNRTSWGLSVSVTQAQRSCDCPPMAQWAEQRNDTLNTFLWTWLSGPYLWRPVGTGTHSQDMVLVHTLPVHRESYSPLESERTGSQG